MTGTVTHVTTEFVLQTSRSYQFTTVGVTMILLTIVLLAVHEGIRVSQHQDSIKKAPVVKVFIFPLLLASSFLVSVRFNDILQYEW